MVVFTLLGAGLMMCTVGLLHLLAPQMMMEAPGVVLHSVNHLHIIRTVCGGAYIGIGLVFLSGLWWPEERRTVLRAIALILGGFAFGRVFSMLLDGLPVGLYLGVLAAEVFFTVCALVVLRRAFPKT